jgi:hypothetical protein
MIKRIFLFITITYCITVNNNFLTQDSLFFEIPKLYGFENILGDTISNSYKLDKIYKSLFEIDKTGSKIIFFHIGDSHIQADYISHTIRTTLQKKFGNAGRGLISPLKIAKTNEPFNFLTSSKNNWKKQLIISKKQILPIGITGVSIQSRDTIGKITIKTFNTDSLDYSFNRVELFFNKDSSFSITINDTINSWIKDVEFSEKTIFQSDTKTNETNIEFIKTNENQSKFIFYGCSLENNNEGIVYHSVGINGAKYADYNKPNDFTNQLVNIKPNLIILSLGTNESFQVDFDTLNFRLTIDSLVQKIKKTNPNTSILLTTPACSFKNKKKNNNLNLVTKTIIDYATKNDLPYWNLFDITGGENSAINWKKNLLLSNDGVHYTKNGYILQGNLFVLAFLKGYNQYVKYRL